MHKTLFSFSFKYKFKLIWLFFFRELNKSGVRGEVVYVAPCGKKFKQYPDIIRVSKHFIPLLFCKFEKKTNTYKLLDYI